MLISSNPQYVFAPYPPKKHPLPGLDRSLCDKEVWLGFGRLIADNNRPDNKGRSHTKAYPNTQPNTDESILWPHPNV